MSERKPKFHRREYNHIADALGQVYHKAWSRQKMTQEELFTWASGFEAAVTALAEMFDEDNPNFSEMRFYNAVINNGGYTAKELETDDENA